MSSIAVRTAFKDFVEANIGSEKLVDFSGEFADLNKVLDDAGVTPRTPWTAIDFQGDEENPITINADNTQGKYRETGAVLIHVVGIAKLGVAGSILVRAESLREKLRGRRFGPIMVESMTVPNFSQGATLSFESGWVSATFIVGYQYDIDL